MKKLLLTSLLVAAPMVSFAQEANLPVSLSDNELSAISGQAAISLSANQVITGLQQASAVLKVVSPILPSKGKAVVTLVTSAANVAPVVNNLVNGAKPTTKDVVTLATNGIAAGVAISQLSSGL